MNARSVFPARGLRILRKPSDPILPSAPRPARRDCHGRLIAALFDMAAPDAALLDSALMPWCSATFVGARHMLVLEMDADVASRLALTLPEAEFAIKGHVVADLCVDAVGAVVEGRASLSLTILTIEEW